MVPPLRPVSRTGFQIIERDPHVAQLPPSRSNSLSPGSQHDPYDRPRSESRRGEQISPPTLLTESSVTPTIEFDKLVGVISEGQIMELRNLYSNHSLQLHKLVLAGSYLKTLHEETQVMRTHAESLTDRVDRVLSNTVQTILDGDNFLSAFGRAFGNPSLNVIERDGVEQLAHT